MQLRRQRPPTRCGLGTRLNLLALLVQVQVLTHSFRASGERVPPAVGRTLSGLGSSARAGGGDGRLYQKDYEENIWPTLVRDARYNICLYVYVSMCVCMCACVCVHMYVCVYVCMYVYLYIISCRRWCGIRGI
jgi:hypothetical protein